MQSTLKSKKILITDTAGFIGCHLAKKLREEVELNNLTFKIKTFFAATDRRSV